MGASSLQKTTSEIKTGLFRRSASLFYNRLIAPRSIDEDAKRREYILNVILAGSIILLFLLDASILYHFIGQRSHYTDVSPITFSFIPLFFVFLLALSRRGFFVPASYLLIATYFLSTSYAVYRYGVYLPTALLGYAMVIVISGILVSTRFGFFMTALTTFFITPLWYLQVHGILHFQKQNIDGSDGIVFGAIYAIIMLVTWLSNREIERSLQRARKSERELKQERDLLEITVEERTRELGQAQFEKVEQLYRFAEFGQMASGLFHDMVNVLNAVSLRAEDSPATTVGATEQIETFLQAIRRQLDHRRSIELFSLADGIEQVIGLVSYKAHKEHVRIVFGPKPGTTITHFGDPFQFQQVILNLVVNAIESYSLPTKNTRNRIVSITIKQSDGSAMIKVQDEGCGIAPDIQSKIFDPFFSIKTKDNGTGIGLATVKKIVEKEMKGKIIVESEPEKGTVFTVTFPLVNPHTQ